MAHHYSDRPNAIKDAADNFDRSNAATPPRTAENYKPMGDDRETLWVLPDNLEIGFVSETYIPALRFKALAPLYDVIVRLTTREATVKQALIDAALTRDVRTVVDIGCGSGTLTVAIKRQFPKARVIGVDLDEQMLGYTRRKTDKAGLSVELIQANATRLPLDDGLADRVVSSLFFHHLHPKQKRQALAEALRVLAPGGELYVADWGRPSNLLMRALFFPVRLLDGLPNTADHVRGRLPELITQAGADRVESLAEYPTVFGTLTLLRAIKAG